MTIVVDASLALKWQLRDEADLAIADRLLLDSLDGRVELAAPSLWLYEIANGIRAAVARGRVSRELGREAIADYVALDVALFPFAPIAGRSYELAQEYNVAIYDSTYLALAERLQVDLYTADRPLFERARDHLPVVKWFTEYRF